MKTYGKGKVLGRRLLLKSAYFTVVQDDVLFRGKRFPYEWRPHSDVVHIVALTARRQVVLVRQYRHPVGKWLLELPAGSMDGREGPVAAARRELLEETGYAARRWKVLGGWNSSAASTNMRAFIVLGEGARKVRNPAPEPLEFLATKLEPFDRLFGKMGKLKDATFYLQAGMFLAARHLGLLGSARKS